MATQKLPQSQQNRVKQLVNWPKIRLAVEFLRLRAAVITGGICLLASKTLPWPDWVTAPGLPVITGDGAGRVAAVVGLLLIITGIFADGEICRRYSLLSATLGFYALVLALGSLFTPGGLGSTGSMLALLGAFLSIYGGMGYVR